MKTALIFTASLLIGSGAWAITDEIQTVQVAPKGIKAASDELANLYNGPDAETSKTGTDITPLSQRTSTRNAYEVYGYESALEMRSRRRVGVGLATSGQMGLLGVLAELNFAAENSAIMGFGGGTNYRAFSFQWKHVFGGDVISPYSSLGYARWYNASGQKNGINNTTPNALASKFLSDEEKKNGKFAVNLVTPSLGLQYNILVGPYTGMGIFGEIMLLTEIESFRNAATGSVGALYYF